MFNYRYLFIILVFLSWSCNQNENFESEEENVPEEKVSNIIEGKLRIKVSEDIAETIENSRNQGNIITRVATLDNLASSLGATSFTRVFPHAGKFEERTRKAGLHLWYDIEYDEELPVTRALQNFSDIPEISFAEPIYKIKHIAEGSKSVTVELNNSIKTTATASFPFDDPSLSDQWHYHNDGSLNRSVEGSDINLIRAWEFTTGAPDVIVAIVDGGIDVTHPDLQANLWVGEGGINGYNFVNGNNRIIAHNHGTHVAGTVGAVNNNGIGVCGVAGGDGSGNGVRLMSCQIFVTGSDGKDISAGGANAIKYGADNGAVISQNSWGFDDPDNDMNDTPQYMKDAIDYFIEYAGIDEYGNQVGPMKGGVVIFSAGNENTSMAYPASYENVIAVASMATDFRRATYSCYGEWVNITAPGGETSYGSANRVLSTLPDNQYGYMQGTSMACPHVSGVAALIISKYGGIGFTPADLKNRLLNTTGDIYQYNTAYRGRLGTGYLDAAAALASYNNPVGPDPVTTIDIENSRNNITLNWTVTAHAHNIKAHEYIIFYSKNPLDNLDPTISNPEVYSGSIRVRAQKVGNSISYTINNLEFETTYYTRIVGKDFTESLSSLSPQVSITTETNSAPIITARTNYEITLSSTETKALSFDIEDPDGDTFTYTFKDEEGKAATARLSATGTTVTIIIAGSSARPGTYKCYLTAEDEYGANNSVEISYTILEGGDPSEGTELDNIYFGSIGLQKNINLSQYFTGMEGAVEYSFISSTSEFVDITLNSSNLSLTSLKFGLTEISIEAIDELNNVIKASFWVMVRDDSQEIDLYPNPVSDFLNIRMGENVDGNIQITIYNSSGGKVFNSNIYISTFSPAKVNLTNLSSGVYTIVIKYANKEIKRNIIKI